MIPIAIDTTNRPFVPLPTPFDRYHLTVIHRTRDPSSIARILSQTPVAKNLGSVPEPYSLADAESFLARQPQCNDEARYTRQNIDWTEDLKERVPLTIILDSISGELKGDVSIRRNLWEWLNTSEEANAQRKQLVEVNETLPAGDPAVKYSIGFYLNPELQGQGIMTAALQTAMQLARQYMNARHFEGICLADNIGSRRVLEKCGLTLYREVEMVWKDKTVRKVLVLRRDDTVAL